MNWNSTEFVWLDWAVLAIGVIGVIWAVWHAIVKDRKAQKGEDSSAYLFGKGEPWRPRARWTGKPGKSCLRKGPGSKPPWPTSAWKTISTARP